MIEKQKHSKWWVFLAGALVGLAVFSFIYGGLSVVNPLNSDWIWREITHDTAQHHLGWLFYRADASGAMINGLAYPQGLSIVFMDVIPLLALVFKPFANWLPETFQYFGLWGLACYVLMGGLAALLVDKIWRRVSRNSISKWRWLFIAAGALVFCLSPMVIARSFYHPALAGQWIILLGFLIIIDTPKIRTWWKLLLIWSSVLILAVLIHPYFLPMMGVLMLLSVIRYWNQLSGLVWAKLAKSVGAVIVASLASLAVFGLIGGFSQGTGSEVHDLEDKGFNLLSFFNPLGYSSVVPEFPNRSYSPETMMWLGLGVLLALLAASALWLGCYRAGWKKFRVLYSRHRTQCWLIALACLALLVFAIGTRIDMGPITLWQYSVPDKIYEIWSAFRAAAREAWPFYYAVILLLIWWLAAGVARRVPAKQLAVSLAVVVTVMAGAQAVDILASPKVVAKRQGFSQIGARAADFAELDLSDVYEGQKNLIALDDWFRGDQSGTYVMGRTALGYGMTLNTGFFARVPDEIKQDQADWRDKIINGQLSADELADNLFFTSDESLIQQLNDKYSLVKIDEYYFIVPYAD